MAFLEASLNNVLITEEFDHGKIGLFFCIFFRLGLAFNLNSLGLAQVDSENALKAAQFHCLVVIGGLGAGYLQPFIEKSEMTIGK